MDIYFFIFKDKDLLTNCSTLYSIAQNLKFKRAKVPGKKLESVVLGKLHICTLRPKHLQSFWYSDQQCKSSFTYKLFINIFNIRSKFQVQKAEIPNNKLELEYAYLHIVS